MDPGLTFFIYNLAYLIWICWNIEPRLGAIRLFFTYFISGIAGNLVSACFLPGDISVASLAALFGIAALFITDVRINNHSYKRPYLITIILIVGLAFAFAFGLTPIFDQFSTLAGFLMGSIISFAWMKKYNERGMKATSWPTHNNVRVTVCSILIIASLVIGFYLFFSIVPDYNWCSFCVTFNCAEITNWNFRWCPIEN